MIMMMMMTARVDDGARGIVKIEIPNVAECLPPQRSSGGKAVHPP